MFSVKAFQWHPFHTCIGNVHSIITNEKNIRIQKCNIKLLPLPHKPYDRVAEAIGMTANAVRIIVRHSTSSHSGSSTPPGTATPLTTPSGTPTPLATPSMFDNFTVGAICRHVHGKFTAKQAFTIGTLTEDLKRADIIPREPQRWQYGD